MNRFPENLALVLKMLSLSSAELAAGLATDKSVISRWLRGSVSPSAHNLGKLTALVAAKVEGFRTLDWERHPESLATLFGVDAKILSDKAGAGGIPVAVWKQLVGGASARAGAYEGIFKSTRPHPMMAGRFLFEHALVRRDPVGLLRMTMGSPETRVEGWIMPMGGLVYSVASDPITGTMMFGLFTGIGASRVDVFDGLVLIPGADMGRSPTATAIISERVADLTEDDPEADMRRFEALRRLNPLAPSGAVPDRIQAHLARDFGPSHFAEGGDWLLNMSVTRTLSRGPDYDAASIASIVA